MDDSHLPEHRPGAHAARGPGAGIWSLWAVALLIGCDSGISEVREIQSRREQEQRLAAEDDQLGEAFRFIGTLAELDPETAHRRIIGLLNSWLETHSPDGSWERPEIIRTLDAPWSEYPPLEQLDRLRYTERDVEYLRLTYVLRRLATWVEAEGVDDPLWADWLAGIESGQGAERARRLRQVLRLFDWTVRNIALESATLVDGVPPAPQLPTGLEFRGAGYRQLTFETLFRGSGDAWQRARVFIQLCRQIGVDACMLGLPREGGTGADPWAVGVRIEDSVYLFEPQLGLPIPGPSQTGIATLEEARQDASVLRRLNVPGFFDYPIDTPMVAQTVALLDAPTQSLSGNMEHLESGLVGEMRMVLYYDADASAAAFDAIPGIAGARLWPIEIQSDIYHQALQQEASENPMIALWMTSQWAPLRETFPLAQARWKHLTGRFHAEGGKPGAHVMYMQMRLPEFDIERLPDSPELQEKYNPVLQSRRILGESEEKFAQRMAASQYLLRLSKRSATFWISLLHYDTGAFDTAHSWLEKRVLDEDRESNWKEPARYNLARALAQQGQVERAVEYLKTIGDVQEHGNRIRARLMQQEGEPSGS